MYTVTLQSVLALTNLRLVLVYACISKIGIREALGRFAAFRKYTINFMPLALTKGSLIYSRDRYNTTLSLHRFLVAATDIASQPFWKALRPELITRRDGARYSYDP